jgi:hypothetical protein
VLSLQTAYYGADVSIWIDITNPDGIRQWADEFAGEEAAEVRSSIGAYVVLLGRGEGKAGWDEVERVLREVGRVTSIAEGEGWEGVCLGVILGATAGEDDEGWVEGWEVVDGAATGKNEFGEVVGVERVREALETNEWAGEDGDEEDLEEELGFGGELAEGGFEIGENEVDGMRRPLFGREEGEEEEGVEGMEALMLKMQAMRGEFCPRPSGHMLTRMLDLGADMPEAERKKFAAKAVRDLMKTL